MTRKKTPAASGVTAEVAAAPAATKVARKVVKRSAPAKNRQSPAASAAPAKSAKQRPKLVRDSFTMPEADFALVAALKARALGGQRAAKKSELIRAGLHALAALDAPALVATLDGLEPIKTGRPRKGH